VIFLEAQIESNRLTEMDLESALGAPIGIVGSACDGLVEALEESVDPIGDQRTGENLG